MRDHSLAFLEGRTQHDLPADAASAGASPDFQIEAGAALSVVEAALAGLFERREGHALIRLLADLTVGAIKPLAIATQAWCDDLCVAILAGLDAATPGDAEAAGAAARILAPEVDALTTRLCTAALGRGLIGLRRFVFDHPHDRLPDGLLNP